MGNPKVFISHSTSELSSGDRCVKLKEYLAETLPNCGWDVLIDKDIIPGEYWRMDIIHNLTEAQAGIILFNEKAVSESKWVAAEALILSFRKSINPDFQVIPVLLDGKNIKETCFNQYEPFQLKEIQVIYDDRPITPEELGREIIKCLDLSKARLPPMSPWVHGVVNLLDKDKVEMTYLQEAAERLELLYKCDLWDKSGINKRNCLCRTVVELMHYKYPLDYVGAINLLLKQLSISANEFRDYLTTKWVENKAIEIIFCATRNPEEFKILTINTRLQEIIDVYLKRAEIEIPDEDGTPIFFSVSAAAGEGDKAIFDKIDEAIRDNIVPYGSEGSSLSNAVAEQLDQPGDIAICALPMEFAKERILKELTSKYAGTKIIFLVQVGDDSECLELFRYIGGVALHPPLNGDKYKNLYKLKNRLKPKKRFTVYDISR